MNYDNSKYRKIDWKHFIMFHWIINPGLIVMELIMGYRVPKLMLQERNRDKPWVERYKVPCPHCNAVHDGKTWSPQNKTATKNWFGLYCPACGGVIPCLMNIGTFVVLAVTSPIWYWFRKPLYNKWLAKQPERYIQLDLSPQKPHKYTWLRQGIFFGLFMFLVNDLIDLMSEPVNYKKIAVGFVVWMLTGLVFGLMMRATTHIMFAKKKSD
jgi:hypothetical protein